MLKIGVRAHDFGKLPALELFSRIKDAGFDCIQLAIPKAIAGVESFDEVSFDVVKEIDKAQAQTGLEIAVIGCYMDLTNADEAVRNKALEHTKHMLQVAVDLGAHTVASESTYGSVEESLKDEYLERMLPNLGKTLSAAHELKMNYSLEPVFYHALSNKDRFMRLRNRFGSEHFKVIYDPTNMMDPKYLDCQAEYIRNTLNAFAPYADVIHFKDFKVNEDRSYSPCRLGDGRLDVTPIKEYLEMCRNSDLYVIREELELANTEYEVDYLKKLVGRI